MADKTQPPATAPLLHSEAAGEPPSTRLLRKLKTLNKVQVIQEDLESLKEPHTCVLNLDFHSDSVGAFAHASG